MEVSGYAKMYLEWLAENEPEYLRHLLQNHQLNKLEQQIDQKLAQAALVVDQAKKGDRARWTNLKQKAMSR